jgi:hypothetical protein
MLTFVADFSLLFRIGYVFFVKSQSKRPETAAYLENTTLLIPTKLGSQGLILRLIGKVIRTTC